VDREAQRRRGTPPAFLLGASMAKHRNRDAPYTLDEVAAELGVTRQRVEQIEKAALEKVRRGLAEKGIGAEDLPDADGQ